MRNIRFKSLSDLVKNLVTLHTPHTGEKRVFYKDKNKLTEIIAIDEMGNMYKRDGEVIPNYRRAGRMKNIRKI